ncbi:MAG: Flp pilus assembly complex ATPase component TadA, partial [Phycisphaerae bacterium]|nr:Flp pilus assembly complex ATPase component TadA [Phycisphaerae bacterium]
ILVGEMRDLETTSAAITAAETGHLVLSTLHTQNASQTIERIIDIYPGEQQNQIRSMLSNTLQAVISMVLFKRTDVPGMIPACEVMICTPAVRNCIRENRIHEIPNIIETSRGAGMCTLDDSIKALYLNNHISRQQAVARAVRPETLSHALSA